MNRTAFSLIELMVVIAIVAILAAVAIPSYKTYQLKVNVNKTLPLISGQLSNEIVKYNKGNAFSNNIVFGGVTVGPVWVAINQNNIQAMYYEKSTDGNGAVIATLLKGLDSIPGAVAVSGDYPVINNYAYVTIGVRDLGNGVMKTVCGHYFSSDISLQVPFSYLPANCQCAEVLSFIQGPNISGC
jgi:prepilin-type N-terminal cleavage/methylation domain-containing protein